MSTVNIIKYTPLYQEPGREKPKKFLINNMKPSCLLRPEDISHILIIFDLKQLVKVKLTN